LCWWIKIQILRITCFITDIKALYCGQYHESLQLYQERTLPDRRSKPDHKLNKSIVDYRMLWVWHWNYKYGRLATRSDHSTILVIKNDVSKLALKCVFFCKWSGLGLRCSFVHMQYCKSLNLIKAVKMVIHLKL